MPRRARLKLAGVAWHVIQRGNNRTPCFYRHDDYWRYLRTLKEQADAHGCAIHAYVLMTNHVHLLLTPTREDSVGLMMKQLGQRYVQYFNRTHQRSGTLWEGRYRSCLTQNQRYVLACHRYIELNPVRAGLVSEAEQYPWSSYCENAGLRAPEMIDPHPEYLGLGADEKSRQRAYRRLVRFTQHKPVVDEIRAATNSNFVLGDAEFLRTMATVLQRRVAPSAPGRPRH